MKQALLIISIFAISLAACGGAQATPPPATDAPAQEVAATEEAPIPQALPPQGKMPAPSFEALTFYNETVGFGMEYPAAWTTQETMAGDRGSQTLLLSNPDIASLEIVPDGETRVAVNVIAWEPTQDLAAFVDSRKLAWEASGFTLIEEENTIQDLGLATVRIKWQAPNGTTSLWMYAAIGDAYVIISGEGDLELVSEMLRYLRPIGG